MKFTKTVIITLSLGLLFTAVGLYSMTIGVSEALWLYPELANQPFDSWTVEVKLLHENLVYPYREPGVIVVMFGLMFVLVPLISSQVASEVSKS